MLTKQAQEELYNDYYSRGVDLALGQVKVAGKTKEVIKKMIQLPAAAIGSSLSYEVLPMNALDRLAEAGGTDLSALAGYLGATGLGAGAVGAYKGTGKAVDLADAGIQKILKKMKN